ncbi:MAG TPA: hypothetical protein VK453_07510 [Micromonosporaceae bacterium]|nr:hypothetical protein [Micromonosporaceae bacterium]
MPTSRTNRSRNGLALIAGAAAATAIATAAPAAAAIPPSIAVSINGAGVVGNAQSGSASVTPDGRFVAFESYAFNLVPADDNGQRDVFLRDRWGYSVERISVNRAGGSANAESTLGTNAVSADGRFVVFRSTATDLVPGDANGEGADIYVRDRQTRTTSRVSGGAPLTHAEPASISGDGRFVAFVADDSPLVRGDTNGAPDVFVYDRASATVRRASVGPRGVQANSLSSAPVLNGNGRFVAFKSFASNLVPGDPDGAPDVFVRDLRYGLTEKVNYEADGAEFADGVRQGPTISSDGRMVAFAAYEGQVYVRDRARRVTVLGSANSAGVPGNEGSHTPLVSPDGRYVTYFSSATNLAPPLPSMVPLYRRDLVTGTTRRIPVYTTGGAPLDAAVHPFASSNAGVVFNTHATNLPFGVRPQPLPYAEQLYLVGW